MTLPANGQIAMSQVRSELGLSGQISLGQSQVRNLAGILTGQIDMNALHGKSAVSGYRPTTYTGTITNPANAYDGGTSTSLDSSTYASMGSGTLSITTAIFSGFSSVTKSGSLHVNASGSFVDGSDIPPSPGAGRIYIDCSIDGTNWTQMGTFAYPITGTSYTFGLTSGSYSFSNQNLSALQVRFQVQGFLRKAGVAPHITIYSVDATLNIYDIVFVG